MILKSRSYLHSLFEGSLFYSEFGKWLHRFFIALILLNVIAVIIDSDPDMHEKYQSFFDIFEYISVAIFSLEYITRIFISVENENPNNLTHFRLRLKYIFSVIGLIDLLAILPFYLSAFAVADLRFLRLLRILRLFKLSHYFKGLNFFVTVLKKEAMSISSAIFTMLVLVIISASLMYNLEHLAQPEAFTSIPDAIWWAVVTMTTVGYGDVTPVTIGGKFLATFIMLVGVGIVALPAGILAARFGDELQSRKKHLTAHVAHALSDGHVSELENKDLRKLSHKLDISEEDLLRIIESQQIQMLGDTQEIICPHCHKAI